MMLNKLRRKFIFINMLIVILVLIVVFSVVCVVNYRQRVAEVNAALGSALATNAAINTNPLADQGFGLAPHLDFMERDNPRIDIDAPDVEHLTFGKDSNSSDYLPVATYLYIDANTTTLLSKGVQIDDDTLVLAVESAVQAADDGGRLANVGLYYQRRATPKGDLLAFASVAYVDTPVRSLTLTLVLVGLVTIGVFFLISYFLARWALRPVEQAWAQQQQFVADASHELKTPLTVMLANNSILMDHKSDTIQSQMQWIESTQTEAQLMQGLVEDMLFLAKPKNSAIPLQFSAVNLSDLVERNVLQFESVAFEKGITLESNIAKGICVAGDESRLQRLVGTLMDNACKYADEGTTVTSTLSRSGTDIVFRVTNIGATIAPEDLPHIFDRFYRSDKARVREKGGFGLGLAIAQEVVAEHKGSIVATSSDDAVTSFIVTLPG